MAASAVAGVPVTHIAGFIASVISARLLAARTSPLKRRTLALYCLDALCFKHKKFTTLTGKRKKRDTHSPSAAKEMNRTRVALLVALSAAVAGNMLENEIMEAVLFAAVTTITSETADRAAIESAAVCILICVGRSKYKPMPFEMAKQLMKWGQFAEVLGRLQDTPGVVEVHASYLSALALKAPTDKRALEAVAEGISITRKELLSDAVVETVVFNLLEAFSKQIEDETERNEMKSSLTTFLQPVARGAFAAGLDSALRKHFNERRSKKKDRARYVIVDDALVEAMAGTPYFAVKTDAEAATFSEHTLLNCLDHPEPKVRIAGIKRLQQEQRLLEETKGDSPFGKRLRSVLMRRVADDADIKVVTVALGSELVERFCVAKEAVTAIGRRIEGVFKPMSERKRAKLSTRVKEFSRAAIACCLRLAHRNEKLMVHFESLLLALEVQGVLPNTALREVLGEDVAESTKGFVYIRAGDDTSGVGNMQKGRWDGTIQAHIAAVFLWDLDWGLDSVREVYKDVGDEVVEKSTTVMSTINFVVQKCVEHEHVEKKKRNETLAEIVKCVKLCNLEDVDLKPIQLFWDRLATYAGMSSVKLFVTLACEKLSPNKVFSILINSARETKSQRAKEVSLTWASALVKAGVIESDGENLVRILLSGVYVGETSTVALNVCKQLDVRNVQICAKDAATSVFKGLKSVARKMSGAFVPEMEDIERDDLSMRLLKTLPKNERPSPLASVTEENNGQLVFTVFSAIDQNDSSEFLACLRALEGAVADTPESLWMILQALSAVLSQGDFKVEKFVRLVALLSDNIDGRTSTAEVLAVARSLVEHASSASDVNEAVAAGLCKVVGLLRKVCDKNEIGAVADDAIDLLFSLATQSNSVGSFVTRALDDVVEVELDYERLTRRLGAKQTRENTPAKRRRTPARKCREKEREEEEKEESLLPEEIRQSAVTGALEALTRRAEVSEDVRSNLWTFARACSEMVKDEQMKTALADSEYNLALVLRTLTKRADEVLEPDDAAAAVDLCFYEGSEGSMLSSASAELVRALSRKNAPQLCAYIAPFLTLLLSKESTKSSIECLSAVVPALIADGGLGVEKFMKIALDSNPSAASSVRLSVLDCVRLCTDSKSAAAAAVDIVLEEGKEDGPIPLATKLVLAGGSDASEVLAILSGRKDVRLPALSLSVLESPDFMLVLDETLSSTVAEEGPKMDDLDNSFVKLYSVLLKSENSEARPKALAALFSVVPGSVVSRCVRETLNGKDGKRKVRTLNSVVELLEWDTRINDSWLGNEDEQEEPMQFVTNLCESLRGCITGDGLKDNTKAEIVSLAVQAIETIARRWRPETSELLVEIRNCGSALASLLGDVTKLKAEGGILARALTSLAAVISTVGKTGTVFVPLLTAAIAGVVEEIPKTRAKHPPLDAAIAAAHEVLLCAPKMFGKKPLRRIASVAAVAEREQITGFLDAAVSKVPVASSVDALSHVLQTSKNEPNACRVVMHSVVKMLNAARKRDVREHRADIFQLCLDVLDFRRRTCRDEEGQVVDADTSACSKVEETVFGAVGELMLRLAEAPVNDLFATAAAWAAEEALDEEEVERLGVDSPATILRMYPLLSMYGSLFGTLGRFAVKPFGAILNEALLLVRSRPTKLSSRLGKRAKPEGVICVEAARGEATRAALDATEKFLRAIPDATAVSEDALERVRDAVAIALDGGGDVQACVAALAERMCVSDEVRTKEHCRKMLTGLSRAILLRARENSPATRLKAVQCVHAVLETVGDEYLVALPEAMPILADTVDDEVEEVARATKEFVRRLEAYTGQPIMEELKA